MTSMTMRFLTAPRSMSVSPSGSLRPERYLVQLNTQVGSAPHAVRRRSPGCRRYPDRRREGPQTSAAALDALAADDARGFLRNLEGGGRAADEGRREGAR